jgi:hypothetical protein
VDLEERVVRKGKRAGKEEGRQDDGNGGYGHAG